MKTYKVLLTIIFATFIGLSASAQSHDHGNMNTKPASDKSHVDNYKSMKTDSIKVSGLCSMCKARIEKAAKEGGVANASWDSKTQLLSFVYDPVKTNSEAISKKIASVGHDTEKHKASDEVYAKLHSCCHYVRIK